MTRCRVRESVSISRRKVLRTGLLFFLTVFLMGCEAVFTYSPFSFLQRSPENLSDEAKKTFAEDALNSTDTETVKDAYTAIENMIDKEGISDQQKTELRELAADLALKASGLTESVLDAVSGVSAVDMSVLNNPAATEEEKNAVKDEMKTTILEATENIDPLYMQKFVEQIKELPPESVEPEQYVFGAIGILLSDDTVVENLTQDKPVDIENPTVKEAMELLKKSNEAIAESGDTPGADMLSLLGQFGAVIPLGF